MTRQHRTIVTAEGLDAEARLALILDIMEGRADHVVMCECGDPVPGIDGVGHYKSWGDNPYEDLMVLGAIVRGAPIYYPIVLVES